MTESVEPLVVGARNHRNNEEWLRAASLYKKALTQQPQHTEALIGLAQLAFQLGQWQEARRLCLHILDLHPKHVEIWMLLSAVHEAENNLSAAIQDYQTILSFDPQQGRAQLQLGRCLVLTGPTNEGLKHLLKATSLLPQSVDAYYALGLCYHIKQMPGPSLKAFLHTIEINPTFLDGYLTIADLLAEQRRWADARKILQQAESLFPESTLVLDKLAAVFLQMGDVEDAISCVQDQIDLEPENLRPFLNLSMMAQLEQDWELALQVCQKMVEHAPERWEPHYHLGSVQDVLNQTVEAKQSYERAITLGPDVWRPYNNLGYLLLAEQTPEAFAEAAKAFEAAIQRSPKEEPAPRYNLALTKANLGDRDSAIALCVESLSNTLPSHDLYASLQELHDSLCLTP